MYVFGPARPASSSTGVVRRRTTRTSASADLPLGRRRQLASTYLSDPAARGGRVVATYTFDVGALEGALTTRPQRTEQLESRYYPLLEAKVSP